MARESRRTVGRAGPTIAPGRAARRLAPFLAVITAVLAVIALVTWMRVEDLRDLRDLTRATAVVQDRDEHRRGPDDLRVQFPTDQGLQQVTVPYAQEGSARASDEVDVAFVPGDPTRARTVEGWTPAYQTWTMYAVMAALLTLAIGGFGLFSRWRQGRWERDAVVGEAPQEALGRRIVRGSLFLPGLLVGLGLFVAAAFGWLAATGSADRTRFVIAATVMLGSCVATAAFLHWWYGRDGVWTTDDELVARRRSRVRRWPWAQVLELGLVVNSGSAVAAAARVDDGIADDGWVTLARPGAGPLAAHAWAARFRSLADERGLPLTEGLTDMDLADTLASTYRRRWTR